VAAKGLKTKGLKTEAKVAAAGTTEPIAVGTVISDGFILICDEFGTITEVSQAAIEVIGREGDELLDSNIACLDPASPTEPLGAKRAVAVTGPGAGNERAPHALIGYLPDGSDFQFGVEWIPVQSRGRPRYAVILQEPGKRHIAKDIGHALSWASSLGSAVPEPSGLSAEVELGLSRRLVQSVEADLARASLEIHDGVAQSMSNAVHILQALAASPTLDAERRDPIGRVIVLLRQGIADARSISRELLPASLERVGLAKTLKFELENLALVGVVSTFSFSAHDPIPKHVEVALYRISSEALLNVKKHAKASTVTLSVISDGDCVTMSIFDDGVGFSRRAVEDSTQTGLGLVSMQARTGLLGGTFALVSAAGRGTLITVKLSSLSGETAPQGNADKMTGR